MAAEPSPKITSVAWGRMEIVGLEPGKDFKLYPGGGQPWDWGETGMRHNPGVQIADVTDLLQKGVTTLVLSQGMDLKLQIDPTTLKYLEEKGIAVHVAETRKAVDIYNSLAGNTAVGGLFHSTC